MISPLIFTRNPTKIVKESDEAANETLSIVDVPQVIIKTSSQPTTQTLKDQKNGFKEGTATKIKPTRNFK